MTTDSFCVFIDTHDLPVEIMPLRFAPGESGGNFQWPSGMMGQATLDKFHSKGISKMSQILQIADCMTEEQYRADFGSNPKTWVMRRWLERPKIVEQFETRVCRWTKIDTGINLVFLKALRDRLTVAERNANFIWRGTVRRQPEVLQEAIELLQNMFAALP